MKATKAMKTMKAMKAMKTATVSRKPAAKANQATKAMKTMKAMKAMKARTTAALRKPACKKAMKAMRDSDTQTIVGCVGWARGLDGDEVVPVSQLDHFGREYCTFDIPGDWTVARMVRKLQDPGCGPHHLRVVGVAVATETGARRRDSEEGDGNQKDDDEKKDDPEDESSGDNTDTSSSHWKDKTQDNDRKQDDDKTTGDDKQNQDDNKKDDDLLVSTHPASTAWGLDTLNLAWASSFFLLLPGAGVASVTGALEPMVPVLEPILEAEVQAGDCLAEDKVGFTSWCFGYCWTLGCSEAGGAVVEDKVGPQGSHRLITVIMVIVWPLDAQLDPSFLGLCSAALTCFFSEWYGCTTWAQTSVAHLRYLLVLQLPAMDSWSSKTATAIASPVNRESAESPGDCKITAVILAEGQARALVPFPPPQKVDAKASGSASSLSNMPDRVISWSPLDRVLTPEPEDRIIWKKPVATDLVFPPDMPHRVVSWSPLDRVLALEGRSIGQEPVMTPLHPSTHTATDISGTKATPPRKTRSVPGQQMLVVPLEALQEGSEIRDAGVLALATAYRDLVVSPDAKGMASANVPALAVLPCFVRHETAENGASGVTTTALVAGPADAAISDVAMDPEATSTKSEAKAFTDLGASRAGEVPACVLRHAGNSIFNLAGLPHDHFGREGHADRLPWEQQDPYWAVSVAEISAIVSSGGLAAFRLLTMAEQSDADTMGALLSTEFQDLVEWIWRQRWMLLEEFLRGWIAQERDALVWTLLKQATLWAGQYNSLADPEMQKILGDSWNAADKYCVPTEVKFQLLEGLFRDNDFFAPMKALFQDCELRELCMAKPLSTALKVLETFRSKPPAEGLFAFILVSMDKASTVLASSDTTVPCLHYDSHVCTLLDLDKSASFLFTSTSMLLQRLTSTHGDLYKADAPTHLWVFSLATPKAHAAPYLEDILRFRTASAESATGTSAGIKLEAAPSLVVGQKIFRARMGSGVIKVEAEPGDANPTGEMPVVPSEASKTSGHAISSGPALPAVPRETKKTSSVKREHPEPAAPPVLVYDDDDDGGAKPGKPASKLSRKQRRDLQAVEAAGKKTAASRGITYHERFAPAHQYMVPPKHWGQFLQDIYNDANSDCERCQRLLLELRKNGAEDGDSALVSVEPQQTDNERAFQQRLRELKIEENVDQVKKGRRAKGQERALHEDLFEWLAQRRPNQYVNLQTQKLQLRCNRCGEIFSAVRDSTILFVLQHEARPSHVNSLAQAQPRLCLGVDLNSSEHQTRAHGMVDAFKLWATYDCPWYHTSFKCQVNLRDDGKVMVQSLKCFEADEVRMCPPTRPFCRSCFGLCSTEDFCRKVSTWAFRIVLAKLVQARFLECDALWQEAIDILSSSKWEAPVDAEWLQSQSYDTLYSKLQELLGSIPIVLQNPACRKFVATHFSWLPRRQEPKAGPAKQKLLSYVDKLVEAKGISAADQDLSQQILSGALEGNDVARTMVTGILNKAQNLRAGRKRVNASSLPTVDESRIAELGSALSSCSGMASMLDLFVYNAPKLPASSIWRPDLPCFFCPGVDDLKQNAQVILDIIGSDNRDYMVCWDDTTFWPQWSIQGFQDGLYFIGGAGSNAKLRVSDHAPGTLKKTDLAQQCVTFLLKKASTRKFGFDMAMMPKRLSEVTLDTVFEHVGSVLKAVCSAAPAPPCCVAYDNHASHGLMNTFFLGLMPKERYQNTAFFKECVPVVRSLALPCYRFASMAYKGKFCVFGHNDAAHTQKCLTRALRVKTRVVEVGKMKVWPQLMLTRGLPASAWRGTDNQSDTQSSWLLNPQCVDVNQWDCIGLVAFMFLIGHWCGIWLASHSFAQAADIFQCALCGYYLLLFDLMETQGSSARYFHSITVGNLLAICGHMVERMANWPDGCPFRPSATMEDANEHHFGEVKNNIAHRLPTIRAALHTTQMLHMRRKKNMAGFTVDKKKLLPWKALSDDEAGQAGKRAWATVCTYKALTSVGKSAADMGASLQNWWNVVGKQLVADRLRAYGSDEELLDEEEAHSDVEDGAVDPTNPELDQNVEVAQTLACLQAESEVIAEIRDMEKTAADAKDPPPTSGDLVAKASDSTDAKDPPPTSGDVAKASDSTDAKNPAPTSSDVAKASDSTDAKDPAPTSGDTRAMAAKDPDTVDDKQPPMTLEAILQKHGMDKYEPIAGDTEHAMLSRLHKLAPDMLRFVTQMRLGEAFLRPGQVQQPKKPLSQWNQLQKDLSEAQRSFGLQGAKQGRAASWWGFAGLVASRAQHAAAEVEGCKMTDAIIRAPSFFRPSNVLDAGMSRDYQLVVVRLHPLGDNKMAIVSRVFRGSRGSKRSGHKPHEEALPSQECVGLQLVLPQPVEGEQHVFRATCCSPVLCMDPHEDREDLPRLLMEVAPGWFKVRCTATTLLLEVDTSAALGVQAVKDLAPEDTPGFSITSFPHSEAGFKSIRGYMEIMRKMYASTAGRPLCTQDGCVRLWPSWESLLQRAPGYFATTLKHGEIDSSKGISSKEFSRKVCMRFRAIAPTCVTGTEPFLNFLAHVDKVVPELPVE
ncbi:unnamed protein product [Symbiodinium sp. CCMP2592]|nr:unnamed protein product [Symbiodinium sp. CCMP2592]